MVKTNTEKDLYAIVPTAGGPEKWVNRKMLIPDPRGVLRKSIDPLECLPRLMDQQTDNVEDSESEEEGEFVTTGHYDPLDKPSKPGPGGFKGDRSCSPHAEPANLDLGPPIQTLRRSERLKKKRSGSWPKHVT